MGYSNSMFEITDGLFVDPWKVVAVKRVGEGRCAVFFDGQSAMDGGFLIEEDALKIATDILEAREEFDEEPEEGNEDQETEEEE